MFFVLKSAEIFSQDGKLQTGARKKGKVLSRNRERKQETEALLRKIQPAQRYDGRDSRKGFYLLIFRKFCKFWGFLSD